MNYRIIGGAAIAAWSLVCGSGCAGGSQLYGPKSCEPDARTHAAYPTANGAAAVCLPKGQVAFMLCTRELGLLRASSEETSKTTLSVVVPPAGDTKPEVSHATTTKREEGWSEQADLAKARAEMMRACLTMLTAAPPK